MQDNQQDDGQVSTPQNQAIRDGTDLSHEDNEVLWEGQGIRLEKRAEYDRQPYAVIEFRQYASDGEVHKEPVGGIYVTQAELGDMFDAIESGAQ